MITDFYNTYANIACDLERTNVWKCQLANRAIHAISFSLSPLLCAIDLGITVVAHTIYLLSFRLIPFINHETMQDSYSNIVGYSFQQLSGLILSEPAADQPSFIEVSSFGSKPLSFLVQDNSGYLSKYVHVYTRATAWHLADQENFLLRYGLSRVVSLISIPLVTITRVVDVALSLVALTFSVLTHLLTLLTAYNSSVGLVNRRISTIALGGLQAPGMIIKNILDRVEDTIYLRPAIT